MKRILFIAAFAFTSAQAQTIDTSIKSIAAVKIMPVRPNFGDTVKAHWLGVRVSSDDLTGKAEVYWQLMNRVKTTDHPDPTVDVVENIITSGAIGIEGAAYEAYKANKMNLFTLIAEVYGLTIKN